MAEEPRIRAVHTHNLLRAVRGLAHGERDRILARLGENDCDEIDSTSALLWLPMSLHMRLSDAVRDVLGPERNVLLWRTAMTKTYERPMLRGFATTAVEIFGMTPAALFRRSAAVYSHLTRDLGTLVYEPAGESSGTVRLTGFPADAYRFICYVEGLAGCLESTLTLGRATGEVVVRELDEARGDVSYSVSWVQLSKS